MAYVHSTHIIFYIGCNWAHLFIMGLAENIHPLFFGTENEQKHYTQLYVVGLLK